MSYILFKTVIVSHGPAFEDRLHVVGACLLSLFYPRIALA